jgi:uncharacterized protein with PIN domain
VSFWVGFIAISAAISTQKRVCAGNRWPAKRKCSDRNSPADQRENETEQHKRNVCRLESKALGWATLPNEAFARQQFTYHVGRHQGECRFPDHSSGLCSTNLGRSIQRRDLELRRRTAELMVVDSSALVAIVLGEPEAERLLGSMSSTRESIYVSAVSVVETSIVLEARQGPDATRDLGLLLDGVGAEVAAQTDIGVARPTVVSAGSFGTRPPHPRLFGPTTPTSVAGPRRRPRSEQITESITIRLVSEPEAGALTRQRLTEQNHGERSQGTSLRRAPCARFAGIRVAPPARSSDTPTRST